MSHSMVTLRWGHTEMVPVPTECDETQKQSTNPLVIPVA